MQQAHPKEALLLLDPNHSIEFALIPAVPQLKKLTLYNRTKGHVAYKIKTTAPRTFNVSPHVGVLKPEEEAVIEITFGFFGLDSTFFHGFDRDSSLTSDRFLVLSARLPEGSSATANFWQDIPKEELHDHRLRVVYKRVHQDDREIYGNARDLAVAASSQQHYASHLPREVNPMESNQTGFEVCPNQKAVKGAEEDGMQRGPAAPGTLGIAGSGTAMDERGGQAPPAATLLPGEGSYQQLRERIASGSHGASLPADSMVMAGGMFSQRVPKDFNAVNAVKNLKVAGGEVSPHSLGEVSASSALSLGEAGKALQVEGVGISATAGNESLGGTQKMYEAAYNEISRRYAVMQQYNKQLEADIEILKGKVDTARKWKSESNVFYKGILFWIIVLGLAAVVSYVFTISRGG